MRLSLRRFPWVVLATLAVAALSRTVAAEPCGTPEVSASFPPDGATAVPANATLSASYGAPIDIDDEVVVLGGPFGSVPVDMFRNESENTLHATPLSPLEAGSYVLEWPALRGVGTGRGRALSVSFEVDGSNDVDTPSFQGLRAVSWDLSREDDPCTDALTDRLVFELSFGNASDDRDTALLQTLVFETERPGEPAPAPLPILVAAFPADGTLRVKRPANAEGRRCFAAVVRDLTGSTSGGGDREVCVETRHGPFFEGCSLAAGSRGRSAFVPAVIWLGVLALLTRSWRARSRSARETASPRGCAGEANAGSSQMGRAARLYKLTPQRRISGRRQPIPAGKWNPAIVLRARRRRRGATRFGST
jgi:methionine-rich copper-binding protein CopC